MIKIIRGGIIALLAVLWMTSNAAFAREQVAHYFVVSGVVVNSGNGKSIQEFVDYLSRQADYPMEAMFVNSYAKLSDTLREHPDAIAWTCGAPYVEDAESDRQQLVSVPLFNGVPTYHSLILARKPASEHSLSDFAGKVFVYSDPRSNSGYVSPSYALKKQGIDIKEHFRLMIHSGSHEKSITALMGGLADVAAVDEYVWVEYIKQHPQAGQELVEIERMGPYPFTPIVAGAGVSRENIMALNKALINMQSSGQGRKYLSDFGLDGFAYVDKEFFLPIEKMLKVISGSK